MPVSAGRGLPRLPSRLLPRPGLQRRLEGWAPVTVVRGLEGVGKTVLVASWLEEKPPEKVTAVWLAAHASMGEADRLASELHGAWTAAGLPSVGKHLLDLGMPSGGAADGRRVVLVVDNFQHVRDLEVLRDLVALVNRHRDLYLVVCSRGWHPIQSLASASVETCVIPSGELLLGVEEVAELAEVMGRPVDAEQAARLHQAVGGWMAALRLVLDAYGGQGELPIAVAEEYLRTVVLPGIGDRSALEHAMRFSLAGRLEHGLVRDLCDDPDPDACLAALEMPGLFERRYEGERVILTLPRVIRTILRNAYAAWDPERAAAFHRTLAAWYEDRGGEEDLVLGLEHAVAGRDWPKVSRLWMEHLPVLLGEAPARVAACLGEVPDEVVDADPCLLVGRATLRVAAGDRACVETCRQVVERYWGCLDVPQLVYVGTGYLMGLRLLGHFDAALAFSVRLEQRITALVPAIELPVTDYLGWLHLQQGCTHTLVNDHESAVRGYRQAWARRDQGRSRGGFIGVHAAANLAFTCALAGDASATRRWLACHQEIDVTGRWGGHSVGIGAHLATAMLALDRLDEAGLREELALLGNGSAPVELWPFVAFLAAQASLHFDDGAKALAALDDVQAAHDPALSDKGAAAVLLARARADLSIVCGQGQRVRELLRHWAGAEPALEVPLARVHLLGGEYAAARTVANRAVTRRATVRDRLDLLVIKATAALRMGDTGAAGKAARHALGLYRESGILRAWATISPSDLAELCRLAGDQLGEDSRAALAATRRVFPDRLELVRLTKREQSLLVLLEKTASRQEIADQLYLSVNTVKSQLGQLYRKLGTTARDEVLMRARQLGLLS